MKDDGREKAALVQSCRGSTPHAWVLDRHVGCRDPARRRLRKRLLYYGGLRGPRLPLRRVHGRRALQQLELSLLL